MNELQIDYFMAVATNLSFTKTSEELYVSQPAISKQIALLEKELGAKLFIRNNKSTKLTPAGEMYYDFFRDCKYGLRDVQRKVERLQGTQSRSVRVGFLEGWDLTGIMPIIIKRFGEIHPDTKIIISCCGAKELSTMLLTDRLDVIVTMKNTVENISEIECRRLTDMKKCIAFSSSHPLASKEGLRPADFKGETFFAPWGVIDKIVTQRLYTYMHPYGFTPNISFVPNHESMITCVRNGMGVAVCDEWVWALSAPDISWIPIDAEDEISVARFSSEGNVLADELTEIICGIDLDKLQRPYERTLSS
jgi:DNA-binding transcriptional LysR family regulator